MENHKMLLTEENTAGYTFIKQYIPGEIRTHKNTYLHSLIITPKQVFDWAPQSVDELKSNDLEDLLKLNPELIIIGTGVSQHFLDNQLLAPIIQKKIGFEMMNTSAACRTYNLLASENRNVVAGLIIK